MNTQPRAVDARLWEKLIEIASHTGRTADQVLREAVQEYIQRHGRESGHRMPTFVGMLQSSESDISERAEHILAEEMSPYLDDEADA